MQHRWTMTGDAKVLLARQNYYGSLSKQQYDCRLPGTVTYDRSTATFTMTYSHGDYQGSEYCATILLDSDVGYNAIANGDNMVLSWDGVSLLMVTSTPPYIFPLSRPYLYISYFLPPPITYTCTQSYAHISCFHTHYYIIISFLKARAVNKGVISMSNLITAKSGLPSQQVIRLAG